MLACPHFTATFYPAPYPSETGGVALVASTDLVDPGANLAVAVAQMAQRSDYVRGAVPDFWPRGNRHGTLEWETMRRLATPTEATAAAFDAAEALPDSTGWLLVTLPDEGRAWALAPALLREVRGTTRKRGAMTLLGLRWSVDCGPPVEIAIAAEEAALTLETGTELLAEDGDDYLALESYVAPTPP